MDAALRMDCAEIALFDDTDLSTVAIDAKMEFVRQKEAKIYGLQPQK